MGLEEKVAAEQRVVIGALAINLVWRERIRLEADQARQELQTLLVRGKAARLDVARLAREAGISRETAHKLLRGAKGGDDA